MTSHSYDAIDKEMKRISKEENITPKQLHDQFKSKHNGKIPDEWIKDQTSTDNSEMDDQQFMCPVDGKCGKCPIRARKKKEMMAIGYSEEAVDASVPSGDRSSHYSGLPSMLPKKNSSITFAVRKSFTIQK